MKNDLDRNAIQEMLGNLETRLEEYLVEWRRELSIREWPEAGINCRQRPIATDRE